MPSGKARLRLKEERSPFLGRSTCDRRECCNPVPRVESELRASPTAPSRVRCGVIKMIDAGQLGVALPNVQRARRLLWAPSAA